MERALLLSGERDHFTLVGFDAASRGVRIIRAWKSPFNVSWTEPARSQGPIYQLVGVSEGEKSGILFTLEINIEQDTCRITSERPTLGAPAHFVMLRDHSAIALSTYLGGSVALYPITTNAAGTLTLADAPQSELLPSFPYKSVGHCPDSERQRQCHVHQILEDANGLLYAPDLGSDRVWILTRSQTHLQVNGWLQCPPGTGPRHAVLNHDGNIVYVIGELSHVVLAFNLPKCTADEFGPVEGFSPNVIPPNVHPDHQSKMDSSEICLHPTIRNVLYVSNRWERHIAEREPHLKDIPKTRSCGDAIAILVLSDNGKVVDKMTWIRTGLDVIRGMRLSNDGQYMVVCGQEGGGIEVYKISGSKGDEWELLANLDQELEGGIKHAIWL